MVVSGYFKPLANLFLIHLQRGFIMSYDTDIPRMVSAAYLGTYPRLHDDL